MLTIILLITFISLLTLFIGFFEVRIPFLSIPFKMSRGKLSRHNRKMLRKRIWYNEMHKGFIKLPV